MNDRLEMDRSLIIRWLVLVTIVQSIVRATALTNDINISTTTIYSLDDNQIQNTIGVNDCDCLTNYEIKISNDATLYTGQLIRCSNVKDFNQINLINRLSSLTRCSDVEKQFNEIIITKNQFKHFNYTLLQNLNFTIKVDLSLNGIEQIDESSFSGLTSLKYLDLSYNNLKQLDSNTFNGLTSLVKLNLTGNQILNIEDHTFKNLNNLAYLDLNANHIVAIRRNAFVGLTSLLQLNLASNRIQSLEDGVFDSLISTVHKIRLLNNQLICDCNLAWLIKAKERYNKNLIGKVMCSLSYHQPRVKLTSVQHENLVCPKEIHLSEFKMTVNRNNNSTKATMQTGQSFVFNCRAVDGKQFTSIRFYLNDHLIAESSNYIDYLSDQFINTSSLLGSKDLIEFKRSIINVNNYTMNSVEQKLTIHRLNAKDVGQYQCLIQTAFGNNSRKFELKLQGNQHSIYQQFYDLISSKVPNLIMIFNSTLLAIAIIIYLTSCIEMNAYLKHIQLHLWIQLLVLINLFYYSATKHFSTNSKINCQIYGLFIYYLLVSILFSMLLSAYSLYKQLTQRTKVNSGGLMITTSDLDKDKQRQNPLSNAVSLTSPQQYSCVQQAQFNNQYDDEIISQQILMLSRSNEQSQNQFPRFVRFLFNHHTIRYHALHTSLTLFTVLIFGLFNLSQFQTSTRCFANILLVSNFYIFVPLLILTVSLFGLFVMVRCAIKRLYVLHKKLEQRDDALCIRLKSSEHALEHHSNHVRNCTLCFRQFRLDMYWTTSQHCLAQIINFLFYLVLLCLIILTVVSQDLSMMDRTKQTSESYWWLPTGHDSKPNTTATSTISSKLILNSFEKSPITSKNNSIDSNLQSKLLETSLNVQSTKLNTDSFNEQLFTSIYLICTFLLCGHILVHYCFTRQDVREAMKSVLIKTFCLYSCECYKRSRCCRNTNQQSTRSRLSDRYANCTLVPSGILNPNLATQSSLLFDNQHSQSEILL